MTKIGTSQRLKYLLSSIVNRFHRDLMRCPSCGCLEAILVQRKYVVTTLVRCKQCRLLHRRPIDTSKFTDHFYQEEYNEGSITDMPETIGISR